MTMRINTLFVSLLIVACNPDKGDTAGDTTSGEEGSSEGTVGMSSSPTTGEAEGTSSSAGSVSASVTEGGSESSLASSDEGPGETGGSDGTDTGTAESESGTTDVCQAFCAKGDECGDAPGGAMCPQFCAEGLQMGPECGDAFAALLECTLGMTCEEFQAFIDNEDPGPCGEEFAAQMKACAGGDCTVGIGGNMEGTECEYTESCPDTMDKTMSCDAVTCTCLVGDEMVGECAADGVCEDFSGIDAKVKECCGF